MEALPPIVGPVSVSSRSSKFTTGTGTGSGAFPAGFDCVVEERVVGEATLVVVVWRDDVSSQRLVGATAGSETLRRGRPTLRSTMMVIH
jgi:hypothetical protein